MNLICGPCRAAERPRWREKPAVQAGSTVDDAQQVREKRSSANGSCQSTLDGYARVVDRLLTAIGTEPRLYTAEQLRTFVLSQAHGWSHSKSDTLITAVRMFVRFLIAGQECPEHLQYAIPRVAGWRLAREFNLTR
ncbi:MULTISPECIES: hypothetical protein [unclassified Thiocapsa]|uniref:hypothetical protein n=1 Tax=unclassified Thiocapsa TaxID=2641286 RepID=UPI0035B28544